MKEYYDITSYNKNKIVFVKRGDKYITYNECAIYLSDITGLKFTGKHPKLELPFYYFNTIMDYLKKQSIEFMISDNYNITCYKSNPNMFDKVLLTYHILYRSYICSQILFRNHKPLELDDSIC